MGGGRGLQYREANTFVARGVQSWGGEYNCGEESTIVRRGVQMWGGEYNCGEGSTFVGRGVQLCSGQYNHRRDIHHITPHSLLLYNKTK